MSVQPLPDWVRPPVGGFTADDFFSLPDLPRHTELIDGSLVFVSPQRLWHSAVIDMLVSTLDRLAAPTHRAAREMAVVLGPRQVPEPDVVVVKAEAFELDATSFGADDVILAVEAVSPDSVERDREIKPRRYAAAGIPHFWRVEEQDGRATVYVYELEPASAAYTLTGIHHDRVRVPVPFDIDLDLTALG